jgi:hypothetical protein
MPFDAREIVQQWYKEHCTVPNANTDLVKLAEMIEESAKIPDNHIRLPDGRDVPTTTTLHKVLCLWADGKTLEAAALAANPVGEPIGLHTFVSAQK